MKNLWKEVRMDKGCAAMVPRSEVKQQIASHVTDTITKGMTRSINQLGKTIVKSASRGKK